MDNTLDIDSESEVMGTSCNNKKEALLGVTFCFLAQK